VGASIHDTVLISRPVEEVFRYVLDLETSIDAFDPDVESVERTPTGPIAAGTRFALRQTILGGRLTAHVLYTRVEPDRTIEFEASLGPLATSAVMAFEEVASGTMLTFRGDARPAGPFNVLSPLLKSVIGGVWRKRLRRLKRALESRGVDAT
jgi:Polyketide cyclase / dehydrase and lipid transport